MTEVRCPACDRELSRRAVGGLEVDVCAGGCGGIWFDDWELEKVDEQHESAGEQLLEVPRDPALTVDREGRLRCARCPDTVMLRRFSSVKREVRVDECPSCGAVWLDAGELAGIRSEYDSEDERRRAAEDYFGEVFGGQLAAEKAESDRELAKASKFARAFRFLCPSYYIPGKQAGGAF